MIFNAVERKDKPFRQLFTYSVHSVTTKVGSIETFVHIDNGF